MDIHDPYYLIWVSLLIFFLNRFFQKKTGFLKIRESLPFLYINFKCMRAKFQIFQLYILDSDWLDFIHFLGYKYKIRLVSILRKREVQSINLDIHYSKVFSSVDIFSCDTSEQEMFVWFTSVPFKPLCVEKW